MQYRHSTLLRGGLAALALLLAVNLGCTEDEEILELKATVSAVPAQGEAPLLTKLTATVEGGKAPFVFLWGFGDGSDTEGGSVVSHEYTMGGEFPVTVSVRDASGQAVNAQTTVMVSANGIPRVGISATATIGVTPMNATFTATVVGGDAPFNYAWSFCDGGFADTEQVTHEFTTPGACAVQVRVTDANGDTADDALIVHVASNNVPAVEVTADGYFGIAPFAVNFAATAVGGNAPLAYQWSIDDAPVAGANAPTMKATLEGGSHAVKVEVTDADGSTASDTATIIVSDDTTPDVVLTVEGLTDGECAGVTPLLLHFTCTSTLGNDPKTTIIYFGTGDNVAHWDAWYQYTNPGNFTARCEVRDANGNVASAERQIVVAKGQLTTGELATRVTHIVTNMTQKSMTTLQLLLLDQVRHNYDHLRKQFGFMTDIYNFVQSMHAVWQNGMPGNRADIDIDEDGLIALTPNVFAETVQFLLGYVMNEASLFDQGPDMATWRLGNWTDLQICQIYERARILGDLAYADDAYCGDVPRPSYVSECLNQVHYYCDCGDGCRWIENGEFRYLSQARTIMHLMEVAGVWVTAKTHCDTSVDLIVEVGPDRVPVLNMTLWPEKVTGYVEMPQIAKVLNNVAMMADLMAAMPIASPIRIANGLFVGAGKVSFEFAKSTTLADAWALTVAVDEDLSMTGTWENGGYGYGNKASLDGGPWVETMLLNVPATAALLFATFDRGNETLNASIEARGLLELPALTSLRIIQMFRNFYIPQELPGTALFRFDLKGLQGAFSLDADGMMRLDDLGAVGATSGMHLVMGEEASPLVEIDLNTVLGGTPSVVDHWFTLPEDHNRAVLNLSPVEVTRLLTDLCEFYAAIGIAEQSGVNACECNQTYTVAAAPTTEGGEVTVATLRYCPQKRVDQRFDAPRLRRPTVAIEMVKGTLTISTTLVATREPIVVEEGQCLMVRDQCVPMAAESFMDCLYADECPYNLITAEIVQTGTPAADHGTAVVAERATAECGETRTVTVTPDEDYRISELRIDPLQDVEDEARAMPYVVDLSQVQICNDEGLPPIQTWDVFEVCRLADNCAAILVTFTDIREDHLVEVTFDNGPIYGTSGADKLFGTACPDTIVGLAGDDHIDGGFAGPDTMQGGAGNDTYRVDEAGDVVTELASEGTDTVTASIDYTLGANVENLTGTGSEDLILTGNDMANQVYGSSGDDLIYGSSGDDVLWGRGGYNTIYCGPGNDTVYARETVDTIFDCETVLEPPLWLPTGVQTNVPVVDLTGWTQCYVDHYGTYNVPLTNILANCSGANLMLACREVGSDTLITLAQAPRGDVLFPTGNANCNEATATPPHVANGVAWYFDNSYSWGFFHEGDGVNRCSCDTAWGDYPNERLCWHTSGNQLSGGYRCSNVTSLNASTAYERVIFHAN